MISEREYILLNASKVALKTLEVIANYYGGVTQGTDADTLKARTALEHAINLYRPKSAGEAWEQKAHS